MTIIAILSLLLAAATVSAQENTLVLRLEKDVPCKVELPMTHVQITASQEELKVVFTCDEPNMDFVKKKYATPQWDVFGGENVELLVSPFGGTPNYRFLLNPSGNMIQAFMGDSKWRNNSIKGETRKDDASWTAVFTIPFSALEDDDIRKNAPKGRKPLVQGKSWKANFSRTRRTGGQREYFVWDKDADLGAKGKGRIVIPDEIAAAFPPVAIHALAVSEPDDDGKAVCTGTFIALAGRPAFTGEARFMLYIDKERKTVHKLPLSLQAEESKPFSAPITLPEHSGRFSLQVEVADVEGRTVRVSRTITIANPWME